MANMYISLSLVLLSAALVYGQRPKPCGRSLAALGTVISRWSTNIPDFQAQSENSRLRKTTRVGLHGPGRQAAPPLFEGRIATSEPHANFSMYGKFYYDAPNERIRVQETFVAGGRKEMYDTLTLYKENVVYVVNMQTRKCEQYKCLPAFQPAEVPRNATFLGEAYIGKSYLVQTWGGTLPGGSSFYSVWSSDGSCIPITLNTATSVETFTSTSYFDITRGISDPTVWYKPPECA